MPGGDTCRLLRQRICHARNRRARLMDITKTLQELKQRPGFSDHVGMMLVHNGVVRGWSRKEHAAVGRVIVRRFKNLNPAHTPGALAKNHGPFAWGKDAEEAVHNAVVMEQVAKMAYIAYGLNPNLNMNPLLIEKHFNRKHGPNAYYGQQ